MAQGQKKRGGLGTLGRRAFKQSVPELMLLPQQDSFRQNEVAELCGMSAGQLRAVEKAFPEEFPARSKSGPRLYSRHQLEQVLRMKHLFLEEHLAAAEVRSQLSQPVLQGAPVLLLAPPKPPPALLPPPPAPGLPSEAIAELRAELQALVALSNDPD